MDPKQNTSINKVGPEEREAPDEPMLQLSNLDPSSRIVYVLNGIVLGRSPLQPAELEMREHGMDEQELQVRSARLKRPRVLIACQRCKARKTKVSAVTTISVRSLLTLSQCDGNHPTCSSCKRTGSG